MKRVLVTGGAGFIGHRVILELLEMYKDWEIVCLDRLDTSGTLDRLAWVLDCLPDQDADRLKIVFHDMKAEINEFTAEKLGDINVIIHLGAGSHVDRSIEDPMSFVMDNVVGTTTMLNYARKLENLDVFFYFSTDEVFGPAPDGVFYKEWDRYNSGNPYSASKAGAEELCLAFSNTYDMPMIITHTMNVIGKRQHKEKFVPLCIQRSVTGERVFIHADPQCENAGTRHYIDVQDVAEAVDFLLGEFYQGKLKKCDKFNIVGSEEIDNESLYLMINKIVGEELDEFVNVPTNYELVDFHSARAGHDLRYALCGEKMKKLGWSPKPLEDRLRTIVRWYLKPENHLWLGTSVLVDKLIKEAE